MGTRITGIEDKVALYDSVTGTAFGPVFDDSYEAEDFLAWLELKEKKEETFKFGHDEIKFLADPRVYRDSELQEVHHLWQRDSEQ
jgi:hypothetical protein